MKASRYITPEAVDQIKHSIDVLAARNPKLTWAMIAEATGYTRAALSRHEEIKKAYDLAKSDKRTIISDGEQVEELKAKNAKLRAEVVKMKTILEEYDNKYIRWLTNAINAGLSEELLNRPIPKTMKTTVRERGKSK
ncbi:hypothetical protein [Endozoicomonas acroporae]|uniref:hypothetical protein n=1 Tax=Endozoicomonas acroporae TaxID=1701104 RepID=UPI000C789FDA|nr:hypothetical protein [Endozoicomonas acroporae]